MNIEIELQKATKVKPKPKEDRQDYLARLIKAANDMEDDKWGDLAGEAQDFVNAGVEALEAKKAVDDFPDQTEDEEEDKPAPAKKGAKEKASSKKAAKAEAEPAPKKKAAAKEAANGTGEKRKPGAQNMIKKLLVKKPSLSVEEIGEKLEASGLRATQHAIQSIRSGFRNTVKVLQDAGHCKDIKL